MQDLVGSCACCLSTDDVREMYPQTYYCSACREALGRYYAAEAERASLVKPWVAKWLEELSGLRWV